MDGTFGSRLRSQRERQQVPLAVIAEQTKIKLSLLEGLERDDVSQWPAGIFRRSFVRAYAQAIGLDPDAALREFFELYPEPVEEDVPAILAAAREGRRPPTRLGCLISSAINALPAVRVPGTRTRAERGLNLSDDTPPAEPGGAPAEACAPPINEDRLGQNPDSAVSQAAAAPGPAEDRDGGRLTSHELCVVEAHDMAAIADPGPVPSEPAPSRLHENPPDRALARTEIEISAIADLCTRLAVAVHPREVAPVLEEAASVLRAAGLTLWVWDHATRTLRHVLAHGYPGDVASRLPRVRYDADNAIADAFRSAEPQVVRSSADATGALVVPILAPGGRAGVLALEFQDRGEERESVRALATILAAQLATLFGYGPMAEAVSA
jgi:GAF domain-containing protein